MRMERSRNKLRMSLCGYHIGMIRDLDDFSLNLTTQIVIYGTRSGVEYWRSS